MNIMVMNVLWMYILKNCVKRLKKLGYKLFRWFGGLVISLMIVELMFNEIDLLINVSVFCCYYYGNCCFWIFIYLND